MDPAMDHVVRLKLSDMNPHFMCVLCDGYLVDATTIIECLHSFCRTCIVHYLKNSGFCPVCDVQVHKTRPLQSIRSDNTLQDIVYKLVPGLYQNEMKTRQVLYAEHPEHAANCAPEGKGEGADQRPIHIYTPDETISLSLEYLNETKDPTNCLESEEKSTAESEGKDPQKRYLRCPAAISVGHLKKFISMKFGLPTSYTVEVIHHDDILSDEYTLVDIAYKYAWKRTEPMQFFYNIARRRVIKRLRTVGDPVKLPSIKEETVLTENTILTCDPAKENSIPKQKIQKIEEKSVDSSICLPTETSQKDISKQDHVEAAPSAVESSTPENQKPVSPVDPAVKVISSLKETVVSSEAASVPCNASFSETKVTAMPTANGVTLKFVQHHPPVEQVKSRVKKPAGKRAGGRTSRYKSNTRAPLVRLAPYPPPSSAPPVTCLTTSPMTHLTPIAVRNLVSPAVTGLPPSLMSTLRPPTVNTLCNSTMNSMVASSPQLVATHSPFRGYQPQSTSFMPQTINTPSPVVPPRFPSITTSGFVTTTETVTSLRPATSDIPSNVLTSQALPTSQNNISVPIVQPHMQVHIEAQTNPMIQTSSNFTSCAVSTTSTTLPKPCESPKVCSIPVMVSAATSIAISPATVSKPVTNTPVLSLTEKSDSAVVPPITVPCAVRLCPNEVPNNSKGNKQELCKTSVCDVPATEMVTTSKAETKSPVISIPKLTESVPISSVSEIKSNAMSNGIKSPQVKSPLKDSLAFPRTFTIEKKSEDYPFKITVKNTISAEFSDNDDLGCQPDLVVDEQKLDSSDNEDDDALRKKITAIAEKDDEADVTDDTEADSGRASDISSQARSSCDDDVGSPMMTADVDRSLTSTAVTSTSSTTPVFTAHLPPFTTPVQTPSTVSITPAAEEIQRPPAKSLGLDHVISNLYRNHEKKDNIGALDLSTTCPRKPDEENPRSRQKAVANPPVLDVKHRQQTCLSAPKQHTACVPTPKHPTSSNLHLAGLAHHNMLTAAAAASSALHKSMQLPVPYSPLAFPCQPRPSSSPMMGRSTPNYTMNSGMLVPTAHQNMPPMVPHPCMGPPMNTFQGWPPVPPASLSAAQGRSTPSASPRKNDSSPVPSPHNNKVIPPTTKQSCTLPSSNAQHRKTSLNSDCERHTSKSPSSRNGSAMISSPSSPHPYKASPVRSSPNSIGTYSSPKSTFSPTLAPTTTSPLVNNVTSAPATTSSPSYKLSQSTIPIYKKSNSSYKNHGYRFKNCQVINPDPNGDGRKLVIRSLDSSRNNHQPQRL